MARKRARFMAYAFHQATIAYKCISKMINICAVFCIQILLSNRKTNRI